MKQINKLKIIMFSLIIIGTTLSIIGIISTNKQQKIKKQITTENMLFTYETIKNNNYNKSLTEKEGLTSNYQEIKITSSSSSPSQMNYLIYIKPKTQTIKDNEINVYITDEKNIPVSDEYKDLQNGKGKYCYDYINKIKYNIETTEYQKYCSLNNLNENESKYIMDSNYIENTNNEKTNICKKYTNINNNVKETIVDNILCQFGDLYEGKSIPLSKNNDTYDIKNVILASTHLHETKSIKTNTYRIRLWQKKIEDNSSNKKYKYDIEIYPIKVN